MNPFLVGNHLIVDEVCHWIIEYSLCGTVLIMGTIFVSLHAKRQRASLRHAVWLTCMIWLVAIPFMLPLLPKMRIPFQPLLSGHQVNEPGGTVGLKTYSVPIGNESTSVGFVNASEQQIGEFYESSVDGPSRLRGNLATASNGKTATETSWWDRYRASEVIVIGWLFGGLVCLLRLGISSLWIHRVLRRTSSTSGHVIEQEVQAVAREIGFSGPIRIRIDPCRFMPMVVGVVRPVILIPKDVLGRPFDERRAIVLHELGHVIRRDPLTHFLTELAGVFFWFHPLYWFARQRCYLLREQACDDLVLRGSTCPVVYARCLVSVASSRGAMGILPSIGIAMATRRIEQRLRGILCETADRRPTTAKTCISLFLVSLGILLPTVVIRAETPNQNPAVVESNAQTKNGDPTDATPANNGTLHSNVTDTKPKSDSEQSVDSDLKVKTDEGVDQREASDDERSLLVSGTIVDSRGATIENALVFSRIWNTESKREVSIRVVSDAKGQFTLRFPKIPTSEHEMYAVWSWAPGHQIQGAILYWLFRESDHVRNVRLHLPKASPISFRILKPDGEPLENATLVPGLVETYRGVSIDGEFAIDESSSLRYGINVYDEFCEILGVTSDSDGYAKLTNIPPTLFDRVDVISEEFGVQRFGVRPNDNELRLAPVGEIRGRVQIDDPSQVAGTKLHLLSRVLGRGGPFESSAEVKLDKDGRFHVPAFAATGSSIAVLTYDWNEELNVHPFLDRRTNPRVQAGEAIEILIQTVPTVLVHGRVRTADTLQPVVGARTFLNGLSSPINGVRSHTDKDGRFSVRIAPGRTLQQVTNLGDDQSIAEKYDHPSLDTIEIPSGVEEFELEPYLLTPKQVVRGTVRGLVRDARGAGVANAVLVFHSNKTGRIIARTETDAHGMFSVAVSSWAHYQERLTRTSNYGWSILEDESRIENGYRKRDLIPLTVLNDNIDAMILSLP